MEKEVWRKVVGFEELYEVSNIGRVRRILKDKKRSRRILKPKVHVATGYYVVNLSKNGDQTTHRVHRLVAEAFIFRREKYDQVNHINGNGLDNRVENLEWTDASGNIRHAYKNDLIKSSHKVILLKKGAGGGLYHFVSMAEASRFLGRSKNYITERTKSGKFVADGWEVYVMYRN